MSSEKKKEKIVREQKKNKEATVGVKVGKGSLTFGADARVEFNSSSVKNYKYTKKGDAVRNPNPNPSNTKIRNKMGCLSSKPETENRIKYNKNHKRRKMFNLGIGIERGDITMSAHTQIGYASITVNKYDKQNDENTTETGVVVPDQLPIDPDNG
jgi:hypothetical protein